jgi:dihydrofolate reductase
MRKLFLQINVSLDGTARQSPHVVSGDVAAGIGKVKRQPGNDIALFAGARVASSFVGLGLIDECRIILNPVLLAAGTPLFKGGYEKTKLGLRDMRPFDSGALLPTHEPDDTKGAERGRE